MQLIGAHCCEVMYFGCFGFKVELGFLNCDDVCMCVVNNPFELLEFVSESVYVDLQYDDIYLTFTAGPVCLCGVSSPWSVCEVAWTKQNHLLLNPDKITCTLFTPDPAEYTSNLDLTINNKALPMVRTQRLWVLP